MSDRARRRPSPSGEPVNWDDWRDANGDHIVGRVVAKTQAVLADAGVHISAKRVEEAVKAAFKRVWADMLTTLGLTSSSPGVVRAQLQKETLRQALAALGHPLEAPAAGPTAEPEEPLDPETAALRGFLRDESRPPESVLPGLMDLLGEDEPDGENLVEEARFYDPGLTAAAMAVFLMRCMDWMAARRPSLAPKRDRARHALAPVLERDLRDGGVAGRPLAVAMEPAMDSSVEEAARKLSLTEAEVVAAFMEAAARPVARDLFVRFPPRGEGWPRL